MTAHTNPAVKPFTLHVTVQVTMTGKQLTDYGFEYDLRGEERRPHVLEHLCPAVRDALGAVRTPLLADYSSRLLSPARELSHQPYVVSTVIKLGMSRKQQEQWTVEYGLEDVSQVLADVRGYVQAVIQDALDTTPCPLLRDYSTYTVSQPR